MRYEVEKQLIRNEQVAGLPRHRQVRFRQLALEMGKDFLRGQEK